MSYIDEIFAFNDLMLSNRLSTGQIALWYALMYINNTSDRDEWFTAPNRTLEFYTGLTRDGIAKARNVLKQKNIIDFRSNGTRSTSYKLIPMRNSIQDSMQGCIQDSIQDSIQADKNVQGCIQEKVPDNQGFVDFGVQDSMQGCIQARKREKRKEPKEKREKELNNKNNNIHAYARESNAYSCYEQNIGIVSSAVFDRITDYLSQGIEEEMICAAITDAALLNKGSWRYVESILEDKLRKGITTLDGYNRAKADWEKKAPKPDVREKSAGGYEDASEVLKRKYGDKAFERLTGGDADA